jgi:hypothetical protein
VAAERINTGPRDWVDAVVIVVGVALLALAIWGVSVGSASSGESRSANVPWMAHFLGGVATLVGVGLAQRARWRRWGQMLILLAVVILLGALVVFRFVGTWGWVSLIIPAIVLLLATPLVGPMPPPER